jgi:V8-like Glu-specific endopeptidase
LFDYQPHGLRQLAFVASLLLVASACSGVSSGEAPSSVSSAPVLYGEDDRTDPVHAPQNWATLAASSTVALIPGERLSHEGSSVRVIAPTLEQAQGVCEGERFAQQPTAADCSAVLIDDDLVLTAGHCFNYDDSCAHFAYVFDYADDGSGVTVPETSVYGCRALVFVERASQDNSLQDFALIQLDRVATGRPVELAPSAPKAGDELVAIGYPGGLPAKVDRGAVVLQVGVPTAEHFLATMDAFSGNSGGPVFDTSERMLGILTAGAPEDYETHDGCTKPRRVELAPDGGERIQGYRPAVAALCASGYPSARLCGMMARCGDGVCSPEEAGTDCAADCTAPLCTGLDCQAKAEPPAWKQVPISGPQAGATGQSRSWTAGCSVQRANAFGFWPGSATSLVISLFLRRRFRSRRRRASAADPLNLKEPQP